MIQNFRKYKNRPVAAVFQIGLGRWENGRRGKDHIGSILLDTNGKSIQTLRGDGVTSRRDTDKVPSGSGDTRIPGLLEATFHIRNLTPKFLCYFHPNLRDLKYMNYLVRKRL